MGMNHSKCVCNSAQYRERKSIEYTAQSIHPYTSPNIFKIPTINCSSVGGISSRNISARVSSTLATVSNDYKPQHLTDDNLGILSLSNTKFSELKL